MDQGINLIVKLTDASIFVFFFFCSKDKLYICIHILYIDVLYLYNYYDNYPLKFLFLVFIFIFDKFSYQVFVGISLKFGRKKNRKRSVQWKFFFHDFRIFSISFLRRWKKLISLFFLSFPFLRVLRCWSMQTNVHTIKCPLCYVGIFIYTHRRCCAHILPR